MIILAHRANLDGPHPPTENTLAATAAALSEGFGLETDLRRAKDGSFYISHDEALPNPDSDFEKHSALYRMHPGCIVAMNVKELGYENELVNLAAEGALGAEYFYFDFELLERPNPGAAQRKLKALAGGASIRIASRLSDRGENLEQCLAIPGEVVWADEFDSLWLTREHIDAVKCAGRKVFVISPELHGFGRAERLQRWEDFRSWQVDGVCTDFAREARTFFTRCH
jgi:glycerophosphoryl diester phosphodiesterase